MNNNYIKINYVPTVLEEPQPESTSVSQWSVGIAMFAAFVIPFVLLFASARYRAAVNYAQKVGYDSWGMLQPDIKLPLSK
jgi:hypothetical protein